MDLFNVHQKLSFHLLLMSTAHGHRSALIETEAQRLGISVAELEQHLAVTPEQLIQAAARDTEDRARQQARLAAVCDAWWAHTPESHPERQALQTVLAQAGVPRASPDQVRRFLGLLPSHLVGKGVAWGFADTAVREDLLGFAQELAPPLRAWLEPPKPEPMGT